MEFDFIKAGLLFLLLLHYHHITWGGREEQEEEVEEGEVGEQKNEKNKKDFKPNKVESLEPEPDSLSR